MADIFKHKNRNVADKVVFELRQWFLDYTGGETDLFELTEWGRRDVREAMQDIILKSMRPK